MLDKLEKQKLIMVTGKGGVGKSTCTAALGSALAARGRRVLLVETDVYSAMSEILGARGSDGTRIKVEKNLWAVNLKSKECLVNTLKRYVPSERVVRALTSNRVTEAFFDSAPSVNEFVLLDQILTFLQDEKDSFDQVIVDLPASGHAVSFLGVPRTLNGMMRNVGPIAKRALQIADWIEDGKRTGLVAVCLPEEMPVNETIDLAGQVDDAFGRPLDLTLVNMVHNRPFPARFDETFASVSESMGVHGHAIGILSRADEEPIQRVVAGSEIALSWYSRDRRYLDRLHASLDERTDIIELRMVYDIEETQIVRELAGEIEAGGML